MEKKDDADLPSIDWGRADMLIELALNEDLDTVGDVTTNSIIPEDMESRAVLRCKTDGTVVAGLAVAERVFKLVEPRLEFKVFIEDGELSFRRLDALMEVLAPEELVIDLSCRKTAENEYLVVYDRWQKFTNCRVDADVLTKLSKYCAEFLIHAVDMEGKMSGVDGDLTALLADASPLSCVYAGGISSYDDIELIRKRGAGRIDYTVGSALDIFGGHLSYAELVKLSSLG